MTSHINTTHNREFPHILDIAMTYVGDSCRIGEEEETRGKGFHGDCIYISFSSSCGKCHSHRNSLFVTRLIYSCLRGPSPLATS